mgnify:CR=1 FL=1
MKNLAEKLFLIGMNDAAAERVEPTPENIQAVAKVAIDIAAEFERAWSVHPATQKANAEEDDEPYLGTRIG